VSCDPVLPSPPLEPREGPEGGGVTHQLLQSALEEEEESVDEANVETLVQHPSSRVAGTGLSALLQVDETSVLRHGSVGVELGLNCAKLLDPLPVTGCIQHSPESRPTMAYILEELNKLTP